MVCVCWGRAMYLVRQRVVRGWNQWMYWLHVRGMLWAPCSVLLRRGCVWVCVCGGGFTDYMAF